MCRARRSVRGRQSRCASFGSPLTSLAASASYVEPPARLPRRRRPAERPHAGKGGQRAYVAAAAPAQVADIPTDHPTCSKQHAVLQFRQISGRNELGQPELQTKCVPRGPTSRRDDGPPPPIDLESANGTFLNGKRIEPRRFIELRANDCLTFAESTREYILLIEPDG